MNDTEIVDMIRETLTSQLDVCGEYITRWEGDSADDMLCEILGLVSRGKMGDDWQGVNDGE